MVVTEPQQITLKEASGTQTYEASVKAQLRKALTEAHEPIRSAGPGILEVSNFILMSLFSQLGRSLSRRGRNVIIRP
jgi:hypothetical protein